MTQINGVSEHANFYPMLGEEALAELAADIQANGQRDPITVNKDGVLLDGRNRLAACKKLGIEPLVAVYEGDDEGAFVRSSNERRHQPTGSRAMSTALSLAKDGKRKNGRWKRGSVDNGESATTGWAHRIKEAGLVLDEMPELANQVVSSAITLDDAYKQAKAKRDTREAEERARIEEARDEQAREDKAGRYFDNHPEAQAWLDSKPQGTFETMRGAYAAYLEHDREARRAEQQKREAERREKQDLEDRRKRIAARLSQLAPAIRELRTLKQQPPAEREAVLSYMSDFVRVEFEEIEEEITC
ncbi:ParB N-terminal domain-containing protein [Corynebacterium macclintockiae]|uniref:ParB N-terminal domain-containing protein n=1 Tax=Corynebacterium macclintockiae TaxID=2913501 RepID=UPI003EBAF634